MFELIRAHQLNIMLVLCGACFILIFLLLNTRFLNKTRKIILILIETFALFLLWFDRQAYIWSGDVSRTGYVMVRVSNFLVFFLTSAIVFGFNLYLEDLLKNEGGCTVLPKRLRFVSGLTIAGMCLAVVSALTGLYYYFDETNRYHRGDGFLIAYIIPVLGPLIQYTVIRQNRKKFSRLIYTSMLLYIFVPILCGILQIFMYGISIVNMSLVAVSVFLYVFMYLDLNNTVEHAHEIEIKNMQGEQARMHRLFEQTATAFVSAVEKKDEFTKGNALKIAEYAKRIAALAGKSDEECEKVYYAALLHDVGLIGIPDKVIKNDSDPTAEDYEMMRQRPLIGAEILSSITEYPYLSQGAHYSHERYNGTGYPEGLKGEEIPEIARIIAVADAYVSMTTKKRYRDAHPDFMAREAFVKGAGEQFDPAFAQIMLNIMDNDTNRKRGRDTLKLEKEITCAAYRESVSTGISVENAIVNITFECTTDDGPGRFGAPSVILFDSFDRRVHDDDKTIASYHYLEYGEIWFDRHSISSGARKIEERDISDTGPALQDGFYEITAGRYEDHVSLVMRSKQCSRQLIVALPSSTKSAYIGLTGENCRISNITVTPAGRAVGADDIPRIVKPLSYIDHLEADIPNVQVDRSRCAYTEGIRIEKGLKLDFHTQSLPGALLIWHCPYVVIYSSDDGHIGGANYREYTMIKLNGENDEISEFAINRFVMKKKEGFTGWDDWKAANRKGMECSITISKSGNRVTLTTENMGIYIENTAVFNESVPENLYVALTGDQVALTDIRFDR